MNLNTKIKKLKSEGLSPNLLTTLTESQITSLYNRLLESKKKEQKEATTYSTTTTVYNPATDKAQIDAAVNDPTKKKQVTVTKDNKIAVTQGNVPGLSEKEELGEKFESKSQQGLFWARCNKCKTEDCKWCKMAKEFSKSTSKKQYKNMPEKKHPEKTVKYKKKETKEGYLENVGKKVTDTYAKKFASFTPGLAWGGMKENYDKIIEKYTEPTMKKRELLKLIENQIRYKKSLNEDFFYKSKGGMPEMPERKRPEPKRPVWEPEEPVFEPEEPEELEVDEDFDMMSMPSERPDYTEVGPPKRREIEPHWDDDDDDEFDMPDPDEAPKARRLRRMGPEPAVHPGPSPITIPQEPGIKPDKKPIFVPDPDERETIDPEEDPGVQGPFKRDDEPYMKKSFKKDFDKIMSRMNESYYKPIKYKKF